ncbi:gluconeogenesis factor YvcK family protein [Massilibacterium senegalense]|uniref:gluconeogenesis factor YvcK family protein n=1 Tax=Massilibacterium senegalense TaxID=1632858 RepID=UPI0007830667|nr:YvcK family protein [Massilibacterium senegalense]
MDQMIPKVVVIGGGTGLSVLLRALKKFRVDITAVVTVADDGGSSGILRDELDIPPPGDVRNVLVALSEGEPLIEKVFQHRFLHGNGISGHSLGNLLLAAMTSITGDFVSGIKEISRVLNIRGRVLPSANQGVILSAKMKDGTIVQGESKIPLAKKEIDYVFLNTPDVKALPESVEAILEADLIIMGPGSLYTSIIPNLLVPEIQEAVCHAPGKKVYICNVMTQYGETTNFTASDHVKALLKHIDCNQLLDMIVVNDADIPMNVLRRYTEKGAVPVVCDLEHLQQYAPVVIHDHFVKFDEPFIRHDAKKISRLLVNTIREKE